MIAVGIDVSKSKSTVAILIPTEPSWQLHSTWRILSRK